MAADSRILDIKDVLQSGLKEARKLFSFVPFILGRIMANYSDLGNKTYPNEQFIMSAKFRTRCPRTLSNSINLTLKESFRQLVLFAFFSKKVTFDGA